MPDSLGKESDMGHGQIQNQIKQQMGLASMRMSLLRFILEAEAEAYLYSC